jgi:NAD(P)-dependent dehydrogenase (short-subunit alcohol dehydrogenase family)
MGRGLAGAHIAVTGGAGGIGGATCRRRAEAEAVRSVNVSADGPLVTFFAFPGDAGHDYGTIESRGFSKIVVERDGRPEVIDNPAWGAVNGR